MSDLRLNELEQMEEPFLRLLGKAIQHLLSGQERVKRLE